mgnify:CR=1 FL=1
MPVVNFDSETIVEGVLPQVKTSYNEIQTAIGIANGISFPGDDCGWSGVKSKLSDCKADTKKYIDWLSEKNLKTNETIINNDENMENVKVGEIKKRELIVK